MTVVSKLKYLRISPRKVRLVADLIRKNDVREAEQVLRFTVKKAAQPMLKLLKTAIADAKNNFQLEEDNLYVSTVIVDEGPTYKRWRPRSRGMANPIKKRTSHITIILAEKERQNQDKKKRENKKGEVNKVKDEEGEEKTKKKEKAQESEKNISRKGKHTKKRSEIDQSKVKPKNVKGIKRIFRRKAF